MSKKSKEKRRKSTLFSLCLEIISFGTFLILFTPLILSSKFFFPFVGFKSLYFMGFTEIIFFAWLILIFVSPPHRPHFNLLLFSLFVFLFILVLASFFGVNLSSSFWSKFERMTGILMMLHLVAFFLVTSSVFDESDWRKIFVVSIFVGAIISLIALISKNPAMRGGATIGNDSFLGTYLLLNLFLALYLIFKSRGELRIYSSICFLIMALALFLGGARAAQISFLGGLVLLSFLYLAFVPEKGYLKILGMALLAVSLIFALVLSILLFKSGSFVQEKFIQLATKARLVVWKGAWKGFLERPWLGWGPENFDYSFTKHFNPCMPLRECGGEVWFDRAHNIIFDLLVSSGIFGLISYSLIFIFSFYILWKEFFSNKIDFWTAGIFSVAFISYSVQNLTVFDMVSSYLMFFLFLGFIAGLKKGERPETEIRSINPAYLILVLVLFSLSFWKFFILPLKTDAYVIPAVQSPPGSEERLSYYKKTLSTSPVGKFQIREFFADRTLQDLSSEKIQKEGIEKELDFVAQELEKSIKECPVDFRSRLKLAEVYNGYSRLDQSKIQNAEMILSKAIELSPTNQQGYWVLAQTRLYQGRFDEAVILAEKAVELEPRLERSHIILVRIAKIIGDVDLAEKKIEEAIKIDPSWENDLREILQGS